MSYFLPYGVPRLCCHGGVVNPSSRPAYAGCSSSLLTIVQKPDIALRRMSAKRLFVGLGAPAGTLWHDQVTVLDLRHVCEKLVIPRQPVDVGLHDPQIRHCRAEMGVHHGA